MSSTLLHQIQDELVSLKPLSDTLRKALVLAIRLNIPTLSDWIKSELNGYTISGNLPDYRIATCDMRVDYDVQSYAGLYRCTNVPLNWEVASFYRMEIRDGIKTLEVMAQEASKTPSYIISQGASIAEFQIIKEQLAKDRQYLQNANRRTSGNICSQIIDTTKNRLLEFILEIENRAEISGQGIGIKIGNDEATLLFQQIIMGNVRLSKEIKNMNVFDQRGQQVNAQYNAARDINFGAVQNQIQFIEQLEMLQEELTRAIDAGTLDEGIATDANYQMTKAIQQAKKESPDKKSITDHLKTVVSLLSGATALTGLVKGVSEAIEAVQKLFA